MRPMLYAEVYSTIQDTYKLCVPEQEPLHISSNVVQLTPASRRRLVRDTSTTCKRKCDLCGLAWYDDAYMLSRHVRILSNPLLNIIKVRYFSPDSCGLSWTRRESDVEVDSFLQFRSRARALSLFPSHCCNDAVCLKAFCWKEALTHHDQTNVARL